jgi:hypothetical protein
MSEPTTEARRSLMCEIYQGVGERQLDERLEFIENLCDNLLVRKLEL